MKAWVTQLRKGLVELCVMGALQKSEAYGYELLQRLESVEGLRITESTVYPILSRLAADGYVKVRTGPSPLGPPRRYYKLTALGFARFSEMKIHWRHLNIAVESLFKESENE